MKRFFICIFLACFTFSSAFALYINDGAWGYSMDLPEGYSLRDGNGKNRYHFTNAGLPVELIVSLYTKEERTSSKEAAQSVLEQLGARTTNFAQSIWRESETTIAQFDMILNAEDLGGWILAIELKNNKGYAVFLSFTAKAEELTYQHVLISCLDSISVDKQGWHETGPMTSFIYQNEGTISQDIQVNGKTISISMDKIDAEANQYIVDREFYILSMYANSPLWQEAWQRYYRLIYRDAYKRLERTSDMLYRGITSNTAMSDYDFANTILKWTQTFTYARNFEGSDFTSVPALAQGVGGDCDSRAMLFTVIMRHLGYNATLFVSRDYAHALAAIELETEGGVRIEFVDTHYLLGETTTDINLGSIFEEHKDGSKWLGIPIYDISN